MPKQINFSLDAKLEFKEDTGGFDGVLVNYNHQKLGHNTFRFAKGSMGINEGKKLHLMYNHNGNMIPVGQIFGEDSENGFNIKAEFALEKDEGGYINREAAALYIQSKKVPFDLSVGGVITKFSRTSENGKNVILIEEFKAHEGSITPHGAIEGSKITKVFGENGGDEDMPGTNGITIEQMKQMFSEFTKEMIGAQSSKEVEALPGKFAELQAEFAKIQNSITVEFKEELDEKFKEIDGVIKGLKTGFKATEEQMSRAEEFMAVVNELNNGAKNFTVEPGTELNFATTGTTTDAKTSAAVKAQYLTGILKRLQEANPLFAKLRLINITENSLELDREEIGLPEIAWVGEEDVRSETDINALKDVDIKLHQIYAMPKLSNKLIATNYVGYVDFLLSRTEYAWGVKIANTMLNGTGVKQPLGILKDTNVTNKVEWAAAVTDEELADSIVETFNNTRDEISSKSSWIFRRTTWTKLSKIKDKDGKYKITDIKEGSSRTLMGRPVIIIDSPNSGLYDFDTAEATNEIGIFGDIENGMLGIQNNKLVMNIKDQITQKGFTKYYMEKMLGFGVVLPENFTIIKKKA